jgi:hypothetical protein
MEKVKNFFNKNGLVSFVVLFLIFFVTTCNKNRKIKRITKENVKISLEKDSIVKLVPSLESVELLKLKSEKEIYVKLNNEILLKYKDRQSQITELQQTIITPSIYELSNRIKELESK